MIDPITVLSKEQIRAIFLNNGFTIKEGLDDLKPYVYESALQLMQAMFNQLTLNIVVLVDGRPLRDVLDALNSPPHVLRELQATRDVPGKKSISDLTGEKNPIDALMETFKESSEYRCLLINNIAAITNAGKTD